MLVRVFICAIQRLRVQYIYGTTVLSTVTTKRSTWVAFLTWEKPLVATPAKIISTPSDMAGILFKIQLRAGKHLVGTWTHLVIIVSHVALLHRSLLLLLLFQQRRTVKRQQQVLVCTSIVSYGSTWLDRRGDGELVGEMLVAIPLPVLSATKSFRRLYVQLLHLNSFVMQMSYLRI
jgi:hypothetical protein